MNQRQMSRRMFLYLSGASVAAGFLMACAPVASPGPAAGEQAAAPAAEGGKTLKLWGLQYDPHVARYQMLSEAFTKKSGITLEVEPQGWPIETKVIAALAAGTGPDVTCIMGKQLVPLLKQQALLQIDDVVFKDSGIDVEKWFNPGAIGAYAYDGHYWGVPVEDNMEATFAGARLDFIEEAGDKVKDLWPGNLGKDQFDSYEQLWELAKTLQKADSAGNVTTWGLSSQGWESRVLFSIQRNLGEFWWDAENKKFNLNTPAMMEALRLYITAPVFEHKIETALDVHHVDAIIAGKCAVARGDAGTAGHASRAGVQVEGFLAPSAVEGEPALFVGEGGWGFEVLANSPKVEDGIEFLKWMSSYDGQYIWAGIYGGIAPAIQEINPETSNIFQGDDNIKRSIRRVLKGAPNTVYYGAGFGIPSEMEGIVGSTCEQIRAGQLNAEEGAAQMQEQMEAHYKQEMGG